MGKTKDLGHLASMALYDVSGNMTLPAGLKINGSADVATQSYVGTQLGSYIPSTRSITINGTTYDLSADRSWTITSMIYPAAGIALSTGSAWGTSITNNSANWNTAYGWGNHASAGYLTSINSSQVTTALGYTPYNSTNPSGYITSSALSSYLPLSGGTMSGDITFVNLRSNADSSYGFIGRNVYADTVNGIGADPLELNYYSGGSVIIGTGTTGSKALYAGSLYDSGNRVITTGNIGSQSVSYATSAGSADNIDGVSFVNTGSNSGTAADSINSNGISYVTGNISLFGQTDGALYSQAYNSSWQHQIYGDYRTGQIAIRGKNSGTWQGWRTVIDSSTIGSQSVSYATNSTRLYASDSPYTYGGGAPYYMYMTYDGSRWLLQVSPASPSAVRVSYADSAGSASSATYATYLTSSNYTYRSGTSGNLNTDFQNTPAGTYRYAGDDANVGNSPGGTWWFYQNMRHSNGGNYWGTQIAWGWEDNAHRLATRNITGNSFSGWVYYLNNNNYTSYIDAPNKAGTSYYQVNTWMQLNGVYGLYCPSVNGAHFYPNDSTYGTWKMAGSRNSYSGIQDSYSGVNGIMFDSGGNGGAYRTDSGKWYYYFHLGNNCMGIADSTTSSSYRLYVSGSIYSTGDVVAYSDARLKTNINTIDNAIDKIASLRGVYYDKIGEEDKGRQTGVIAQETETIFPEVVTYAKDIDTYGVAYGNFAGLFIEGFKELKSKIKQQDKRIEELQNIINGFTE